MFALLFRTFPECVDDSDVASSSDEEEQRREREAVKKQQRRAASRIKREQEREQPDEEEEEAEVSRQIKQRRAATPQPGARAARSLQPPRSRSHRNLFFSCWLLVLQIFVEPAAEISNYAVCDIQCFYCFDILRAADRFVLCERCEGFVSCVRCWRRTEFPGETYSLADLELRKEKLLTRDARRQHKLWSRLHEHQFDAEHADWTDPESGDFNTYTYKQLAALREAGPTGTIGHKRKEPTASPAAAATVATTQPTHRTMSAPHSAPAAAAASSSSAASRQQLQPRVAPFSAPHLKTARSLFGSQVLASSSSSSSSSAAQPSSKSAPARSLAMQRPCEDKEDDKENDAPPKPSQDSEAKPRSKATPVNKGATSSSARSVFRDRMEHVQAVSLLSATSLLFQQQQPPQPPQQSSKPTTAIITDAPPSKTPCPPPDAALTKLYASKPLEHSSAIEVRASAHLPPLLGHPCELGVFATRDIPIGAPICYYASHHAYKKHVRPEFSSHARSLANTDLVLDGIPTARLFSRYIAHTQAGITGVLKMPALAFLPRAGTVEAKLLSQLAIGCMINSPAGRPGDRPVNPNVSVRHIHTKDADGLQMGSVHCLYAKFNIKIGEELLCCYNNPEERGDRAWQAAGTVTTAAAAAGSSSD